jgi:hypothetical protein
MKISMYGIFFLLNLPVSKTIAQDVFYSKAIKLDPSIINNNGGCIVMQDIMMDWSIGGLASTLIYKEKVTTILSIGFLQNAYDIVTIYNDINDFGLQIKIGPNPFYNDLYFYCKQDGIVIDAIKLFDGQGNLIKSIKGPFSGLQFEQHISIQKLISPTCFVQIQYVVANKYASASIYKLIQY